MSEDLEQDSQNDQQEEIENDGTKGSSVPIISDKEIEAIFVGGVPADADEGKILSSSLSTEQLPKVRGHQVC